MVNASILQDGTLITIPINVGKYGLVNIEEGSYFSVVNALKLLLFFRCQFQIITSGDNLLRIIAVHVLIPVIEKERYTFLVFSY